MDTLTLQQGFTAIQSSLIFIYINTKAHVLQKTIILGFSGLFTPDNTNGRSDGKLLFDI